MNLSTIEMPREEAKERYDAYAAAVRRRHSEEDAAIAAGYRALSQGKRILNLPATIGAGGVDELARPRLAVAPATADFVWLSISRRGGYDDRAGQWRSWPNGGATFAVNPNGRSTSIRNRVTVPAGTLPVDDDAPQPGGTWRYRAMVPVVPPQHRPTRALTTYHVLFEAEWHEHQPPAPVDPALIQHLRGDLWLLVAEWDLTDLERAVLSERLR